MASTIDKRDILRVYVTFLEAQFCQWLERQTVQNTPLPHTA